MKNFVKLMVILPLLLACIFTGLTVNAAPSNDGYVRVVALDVYTRRPILTRYTAVKPYTNADSYYDIVRSFYQLEVYEGSELGNYYITNFAPGIGGRVSEEEKKLLDTYGVDIIIWATPRMQRLQIQHNLPGQNPLYEYAYVDTAGYYGYDGYYGYPYYGYPGYYPSGAVSWNPYYGINSWYAPGYVNTSVQAVNGTSYVPASIYYKPMVVYNSYIENAYDAFGNKLNTSSFIIQNPAIVVDYAKSAPVSWIY